MSDDPQLEAFLRQFRPRRPAPLPRLGRRPAYFRRMLVAAAAVVAAVGVWRWTPRPDSISELLPSASRGPTVVTLVGINAAVRGGTHESVLDEMDARVLPDPTCPGGALRALADVSQTYQDPWAGRKE